MGVVSVLFEVVGIEGLRCRLLAAISRVRRFDVSKRVEGAWKETRKMA